MEGEGEENEGVGDQEMEQEGKEEKREEPDASKRGGRDGG